MKMHPSLLYSLFVYLLVIHPMAQADDAQDVQNAIENFYSALSRGDFNEVNRYLLPEGFTEYSSRGGLKIDITVPLLKNLIETGLLVDVTLKNIEVFVSGDMAYATYYRIGTIARPDKESLGPHTARVTAVWIKRNDGWRLLHVHNSQSGI